jgi:hypothetical protein
MLSDLGLDVFTLGGGALLKRKKSGTSHDPEKSKKRKPTLVLRTPRLEEFLTPFGQDESSYGPVDDLIYLPVGNATCCST